MNWLTGSKMGEARKLIHQLKDASKRELAAQELIRMGDAAAPALIEALQTKDQSLLPLYQELLTRIGRAAVPALIHSLLNDHPEIRGRVAETLAEIKDPQAVPALLQALHGDFYTVRAAAARALATTADDRAIQPLVEALADREPEVRIGAVQALGQLNQPDTFDRMADLLLEDPEIAVRQVAARALGETGHPQALSYLMFALRDSFWWYEREHAAGELLDAIARMKTLAVAPLLEALKDSEGTVRRYAATLLGKIGDAHAIQPLGMALYDIHYEVGQAAAESLAGFGEAGLKVLAGALRHPEAWLRQHAVTGLTLSGDRRIVPVLVGMLKDTEREVVKLVIQSLGKFGDSRALPALRAIALNRADKELSGLARQAMERLE